MTNNFDFAAIATANSCQLDADVSQHDYSEHFEAVHGQLLLLRIGLWSNSFEAIYQLEAAPLADAWHAESGDVMPPRRDYQQAYFPTFEAAMSALCDIVRVIQPDEPFV